MLQNGIEHHLNWRAWPWRITSRPLRALIFRSLRFYIRARRASLARAVLVVRKADGSILVQPDRAGNLRLPFIRLNGWEPIAPQVESGARQILGCDLNPTFEAVEGYCGDVMFVYATDPLASVDAVGEAHWLEPQSADQHLPHADLECIRLHV